jgi:hypothetical protein
VQFVSFDVGHQRLTRTDSAPDGSRCGKNEKKIVPDARTGFLEGKGVFLDRDGAFLDRDGAFLVADVAAMLVETEV